MLSYQVNAQCDFFFNLPRFLLCEPNIHYNLSANFAYIIFFILLRKLNQMNLASLNFTSDANEIKKSEITHPSALGKQNKG